MLTDLLRAFAMLGEPGSAASCWLGDRASLAPWLALVRRRRGAGALGFEHRLRLARPRLRRCWAGWAPCASPGSCSPASSSRVSGVFLDRVVDATEARYYPLCRRRARCRWRRRSLPAACAAGDRPGAEPARAARSTSCPVLNLPVWLALNGYLVGREYAELVACAGLPRRSVARAAARASAGLLGRRRGDRAAARGAGAQPGRARSSAPPSDPALQRYGGERHTRIARIRISAIYRMGVSGFGLTWRRPRA